MELVYLWVEDYKNIHKQGFNFSPKFNCHYDEDTNELTIDENDDYIENFFGDNINVTAIVGKNGSGKSSVLEAIQILMVIPKINDVYDFDKYKMVGIFFNKNDEKMYQKNINLDYEIKLKTLQYSKIIRKDNIDQYPYTIYYNYGLDNINQYFDNPHVNFNKLYHRHDGYSTPVLLLPYKKDNKIDIDLINYLANQNMYDFLVKDNIEVEHIKNFFKPVKFQLLQKLEKLILKDNNMKSDFENILADILSKQKFFTKEKTILSRILSFIKDKEKLLSTRDILIELTWLYILKKTFKVSVNFDVEQSRNEFDLRKEFTKIKKYNTYEKYYKKYIIKELSEYHTIKIQQSFKFLNYLSLQEDDFNLDNPSHIYTFCKKDTKLLINIAPWIDVVLYDKNDTVFNSLSYGQKFLIRFIYSLIYQLNNLKYRYKHINILLDEVEIGLHPQWQKEFLSLIIDTLQMYNLKRKNKSTFHLVFATHSPFLLSDLPKENVIFLDTYKKEDKEVKSKKQKEGNCKNVTKTTDINPFGANIHTLLSDGFFMEEGLMGEFAKGKINEIKEFYEKVIEEKKTDENIEFYNEHKKKFWEIQKIIGEPFLQKIVQNQLEEIELILLGRDEAIDNEIARLQDLKESSKNA
jgi:predicted ATP-binding protein involved in virulence